MLALVFALACGGGVPHDHEAHEHEHGEHGQEGHRFDDPERWSKVFDADDRDGWQQPAKVIAALDLKPGMAVADIGAGTGYFNPHLAAAVGAEGKVIAIDIEPAMVEHMAARATAEATPQVEARLATPDDAKLAAAEVDRVLLVDTYHHIGDRGAYFGALRAALKPGGRLVVVDLTKDAPFGPPPEHRIPLEAVTAELAEAGWRLHGSASLPHQYVGVYAPDGA